MPELVNEQRRSHRAQKLRCQREVIVLNPRHGSASTPFCFVRHRVREAQIHRAVALPEFRPEFEVLDDTLLMADGETYPVPRGSVIRTSLIKGPDIPDLAS